MNVKHMEKTIINVILSTLMALFQTSVELQHEAGTRVVMIKWLKLARFLLTLHHESRVSIFIIGIHGIAILHP